MSLVTSASIWTNDDTSSSQKRVPVMRKTVKKLPSAYVSSTGEPEEYVSQEKVYKDTITMNSIESTQSDNSEKALRVNELLNKITAANDAGIGNKLANYTPMDPPILNKKSDDNSDVSDYSPVQDVGTPLRLPTPNFKNSDTTVNYSANQPDLGNYGNYRTSYDPARLTANAKTPYYSGMGIGATGNLDDKLMQKINYMVHLLEEQQNEKTSNITEEFVLYTFLGIFVIFIVDSFARAGKYKR